MASDRGVVSLALVATHVRLPSEASALRSRLVATLRLLYRNRLKRILDVLIAMSALVLLAPVLGLAYALVRTTTTGPGVFAQERTGRGGHPFTVYKLRTMYVDPDRLVDRSELERRYAEGQIYKSDDDPRITPVGRWLRRSSIDELPQLWNVVRGDMSLVGPRPLMPHMLTPYPDAAAVRSQVRPGITGLWQISQRDDCCSFRGMVEPDTRYVREYGPELDLRILLRTVAVVLDARGAR